MSDNIITTRNYTGPERRGYSMIQPERRETNEVAIARLEVNVEYIKQAVDEIKTYLPALQTSEAKTASVSQRLDDHIADHKVHSASTKMLWLGIPPILISLGTLAYLIAK